MDIKIAKLALCRNISGSNFWHLLDKQYAVVFYSNTEILKLILYEKLNNLASYMPRHQFQTSIFDCRIRNVTGNFNIVIVMIENETAKC